MENNQERYSYIYQSDGEIKEENKTKRIISDEEVFNKEFGWYHYIYIAGNGILKDMHDVYKMNALEFLHYVNYTIRKNQIDIARIKKDSNV